MPSNQPPVLGGAKGDGVGPPEDLKFADHLQEVVARFDPRLRHTYVNHAIERLTGLKPAHFLGKTNQELGMPGALVAQWDQALHSVFETGQASEVSFSFAGLDRVHQLTSALLPERDAAGRVCSVLSVGRDTEVLASLRAQRQVQTQQRAQAWVTAVSPGLAALDSQLREGHFRAMVQSSDDAIISKTLDGRVTSWNAGAHKMFGYTEAEMLGKPMLLLFPKGKRDEEVFMLERLAEGERVAHFETVRVCKDGSLVDVSVSLSPICDATGQVVGISKIARNISQAKQLQQRLQMALEATDDGLWDWDMRSGRVLRSAQYYTLVGSHEDTQDFEFFKRNIHPDDVARVMQCIEAHLRGESTLLAFEYRLPTAPGQPAKWLRASGRVIERDAYGNPARMLGTLADISPRKAAEALAAQLQEQLLQLQQTGRGALQGKLP